MEAILHKHRLRWTVHVARMADDRIPKQIMYGELEMAIRPQHKPKVRYKDCLKESLYKCNIGLDNWETLAEDPISWRTGIADGIKMRHQINMHNCPLKFCLLSSLLSTDCLIFFHTQ